MNDKFAASEWNTGKLSEDGKCCLSRGVAFDFILQL